MSETKKDNGFTRWSKKHAELWKFIKYSIAGGSSSAVELIVHMVLLNTAFMYTPPGAVGRPCGCHDLWVPAEGSRDPMADD